MPKIKPNMQKHKITISRRPILVIVAILVIAAAGLILAKILTNNNTATSDPNQPPQPTTPATPNTTSSQYNNNATNSSTQQVSADTITGLITYADVSDQQLNIGTMIDQLLPDGTCTLTLSQGDTTRTYNTKVVDNPSTSACETFTIPTADLHPGQWQINIKVNSEQKTGELQGEATV